MIHVDDSTFLSHDLHLLESVELKNRIKHIVEVIEEVTWEDVDPDILTRCVACTLCPRYPIYLSYCSSEFVWIDTVQLFCWRCSTICRKFL